MLMPVCVFLHTFFVCVCRCERTWTGCCWVESVSRGKEKDKCSLKIAPGQLVYTVYQQSVPGAKEGRAREGLGVGGEKMGSEKETADGCEEKKCGIGSGMQREKDDGGGGGMQSV